MTERGAKRIQRKQRVWHRVRRRRSILAGIALSAALLGGACSPPACVATEVFGLRPGIRAGASLSRLSLTATLPDVNNDFHSGFMVGATLAYEDLPVVGLETQVMYIEQGGELKGSIEVFGDRLEGSAKFKVAYLTVPLLVSFKAPGVTVRPYAKLGPQVGFRISANVEAKDTSNVSVENDIKDETNGVDWSLYFAGGVELPLTTVSAFVEVGYSFGFVDLFSRDQNLGQPVNAKNQVLAITAGLSY